MNGYLPSWPQVSRETLAVLAATLIAAYIISRVPALAQFVGANSLTVKNSYYEA